MSRSFLSAVYKLIEGSASYEQAGSLMAEALATGDATVDTGPPWPFPSCPLNGTVAQATAETWYDNHAGMTDNQDGFFLAPTTIRIRRPGHLNASLVNAASGYGYNAAYADSFPDGFNMPHDCVVSITHTASGGVTAYNGWGYIFFENIEFWQNQPVQIDWLAFTGELFDPALGGGVEILCCGTPGNSEGLDRNDEGLDEFAARSLYQWGLLNGTTNYAGDPALLPAVGELLYTITEPGQLPITIDVPAGRALYFRTVNQDPTSMPIGNTIFGDINVGFAAPDPPAAYKVVRSESPEQTSIFTVTGANRLKLKPLVREVPFGGVLDYVHGVLVYRDPARIAGNTLRFPITAPFLWYTEDPEDTFIGGGMDAIITAYEVDESELVGTTAENWQTIKEWTYSDIQTRLGATLASHSMTTISQDAFSVGAGNFDADLTGGRRLVYYEITSASDGAHPGGGLHLPSILHSNASIF